MLKLGDVVVFGKRESIVAAVNSSVETLYDILIPNKAELIQKVTEDEFKALVAASAAYGVMLYNSVWVRINNVPETYLRQESKGIVASDPEMDKARTLVSIRHQLREKGVQRAIIEAHEFGITLHLMPSDFNVKLDTDIQITYQALNLWNKLFLRSMKFIW